MVYGMQNLFVNTTDNVKIALNHYKTGHKDVLILVHGWFMTKDSRSFKQMAEEFSKSFDIISMDCRGHGKSDGQYTFTVEEDKDLKCVVEYAETSYENIYLMGFSLGAAIAILYGAKHDDISKIIAVSPPSRFEKIENRVWHPNAWIPTFQKFELKTWLSIRPDYAQLLFGKKTAPADVIKDVKYPVLFIAGEKDPTVCEWHTRALYEKCKSAKEYYFVKDGLHAEDLFIADKEGFVKRCCDWLNES